MRYVVAVLAAFAVVIAVALAGSSASAHHCKGSHRTAPGCTPTPTPTATPTPTPTPPSGDPVVTVAGDIAESATSGEPTAKLIDAINPTAVLTVGDNAYPDGALSQFMAYYDPSWGRHNGKVRPTPGNHEYSTSGASGYFSYFGLRAGDPGRGYYSYDIGAWHLIALNSNISRSVGSTQEQWLRQDLQSHAARCTLAYWHHPRWTSGQNHSNDTASDSFWRALYENGADVVVNGHNHQYERFAPQNPSGQRDDLIGIREFVAGTGGAGLYAFSTVRTNSEVRGSTYGVLKLTLHATSYDWRFQPIAGQTFTDSGTTSCH